MKRTNISSNSPWEDIYGYSRAVILDNHVHISGTTGTDEEGNPISPEIYEQTKFALQKIGQVLDENGSSLDNVYRTRTFVTKINEWEQVAQAHEEVFREIKPAASLIGVDALISDEILVEIEVDAYLSNT